MNLTRRIIYKLASTKTALLLIILLAAFCAIAAFSPAIVTERFTKDIAEFLGTSPQFESSLDFTDRFQTFGMALLLVSVALSLLVSVSLRIKGELGRMRHEKHRTYTQLLEPESRERVCAVADILQRHRYRTVMRSSPAQAVIVGIKGGAGTWGSLLLHGSLLILLVGIVLSTHMSFEGVVALTEGELFESKSFRYLHQKVGRFYSAPKKQFSMRLVKVTPNYIVNGASTTASTVEIISAGKAVQAPVYVNNGMTVAGRTIHQGIKTGFSPYVLVAKSDGTPLLEGFVRLANRTQGDIRVHRDFVELPEQNLRIELELFPDAVYRGSRYVSRSDELKNPVLHIRLRSGEEILADQYLTSGHLVEAGNYVIGFGETRRWSHFEVSHDPGILVLILGVLMAAIGLVLRLLFVRREVTVVLHSDQSRRWFEISGKTEKFKETFKEEMHSLQVSITVTLSQIVSNVTDNVLQEKEIDLVGTQ